ncbi:MAG: SRPBCC domain-containing protein [Bacteroidetes bacterium]|nr:SRPBCC domain-containing protein [Bacteroidota bacterium]
MLRVEVDTLTAYKDYFNEAFPRALQLLKQNAENLLAVVSVTINADINYVWETFNNPEHITGWCYASDDWHAPQAQNDLRVDGKFCTVMAARDGSFKFDWEGIYTDVIDKQRIAYTMADNRKVEISFAEEGNTVTVTEAFNPEDENPIAMQKAGWQAILNNFKKYTERKHAESIRAGL